MRKKEKIARAKRRHCCKIFIFNFLKLFFLICAVMSIYKTYEANKKAAEELSEELDFEFSEDAI